MECECRRQLCTVHARNATAHVWLCSLLQATATAIAESIADLLVSCETTGSSSIACGNTQGFATAAAEAAAEAFARGPASASSICPGCLCVVDASTLTAVSVEQHADAARFVSSSLLLFSRKPRSKPRSRPSKTQICVAGDGSSFGEELVASSIATNSADAIESVFASATAVGGVCGVTVTGRSQVPGRPRTPPVAPPARMQCSSQQAAGQVQQWLSRHPMHGLQPLAAHSAGSLPHL